MSVNPLLKTNCVAAIERLEQRRLLSIQPIGGEFQVNDYTTGDQIPGGVAMDSDGNFVVVYGRAEGPGDDYGIFARRFNAAGVPQGDEFLVNTYTIDRQEQPSIAMDADGDFVVAWGSYSQDGFADATRSHESGVYARRYNAAGVPQTPEFRVHTYTPDAQGSPSVAMEPGGNFVICWESNGQDGHGFGIYGKRYNAAGIPQGEEFRVNAMFTDSQRSPRVAMDHDGNFVVTFWSFTSQLIWARRFSASAVPQGDEFRVNGEGIGLNSNPDIAMDPDGDFVVSWNDGFGPSRRIKARLYDADGLPQTDDIALSSVRSQSPRVSMADDGRFVVAWSGQQDRSGYGVYARAYDAAGNPRGSEFRVNSTTTNSQSNGHVAVKHDGDFLIVWGSQNQDGSGFGAYAQRYAIVPTVSASSFVFDDAPHEIRFVFDEDVSASLGSDDVVLENLTTGQTIPSSELALSYDSSTNIATFGYTGNASGIAGVLPDGNYRATLVASGVTTPNGQPLPANYVLTFFFLNGDANHDGRVNLDDFNILAQNFGQSDRTFAQADFNYDGVVNLDDFNILAQRFGTVLEDLDAMLA